jgi:hypothetical protein
MPLYEYSDPDTGISIEIRRRVEDRNRPIVLNRTKNIPESIAIYGLGPTQDQQFNADILNGWYAREQEQGSRFNGGGFTKEQIKKVWTDE